MVGKFPNLFRVDSMAFLPRSVKSGCASIMSRTGTEAFFDAYRAAVCFGYTDPEGVPTLLDILVHVRRSGGFDPLCDKMTVNGVSHPASEDNVVRFIQMAKLDPRLKATWAKWHEQVRVGEAAKARDQVFDDGRREVLDRIKSNRERRTMGRYYRGRSVVNGLKSSIGKGA